MKLRKNSIHNGMSSSEIKEQNIESRNRPKRVWSTDFQLRCKSIQWQGGKDSLLTTIVLEKLQVIEKKSLMHTLYKNN